MPGQSSYSPGTVDEVDNLDNLGAVELRRLIRERLTLLEHEQENLKTVLNDPVLLTRHLAKLLELRDLEQRHSR